jgi:DNA-binding CsgD family transcriptional regulator
MRAGQQALQRGAWAEARLEFEAALAGGDFAEGLEALGQAAYLLEDGDTTISARERAYRLYRARGDQAGAARMAACLAEDFFTFRNQLQVANGWLLRAEGLLASDEVSFERGLLATKRGFIAIMGHHDVVAAGRAGAEAVACGRAVGIVDIEMFGLALQGLAQVSSGEVNEGMGYLDEATAVATSGEMMDPTAIGVVCCSLIFACEWVRDFPRAAEWCVRVKEFCQERGLSSLLGICRAHYGAVLMWRGAWDEAEEQFAASSAALSVARPVLAAEAAVRLGELRRRQGRAAEAERIFEDESSHPEAALGRAALALDAGETALAGEWAERFLRRLPADSMTSRVPALEILFRVALADGDAVRAGELADEIAETARGIGTAPLLATAAWAAGLLSEARGQLDPARASLEDAADLFGDCGAPFEAAHARLDLARVLAAMGREGPANRERESAEEALRRLRPSISAAVGGTASPPGGLTGREAEVLRLLATGLSNQEIADHLVLSVRTVERHISTIYEKLGAHGKAARAFATAFATKNGLA